MSERIHQHTRCTVCHKVYDPRMREHWHRPHVARHRAKPVWDQWLDCVPVWAWCIIMALCLVVTVWPRP